MITTRILPALALVGAFSLAPRADAVQATNCVGGKLTGLWDLPQGPGTQGSIDAMLFVGQSTQVAYHMTGTLTEFPTACLSCQLGRFEAFLDDGIGPAPDFVVRGWWSGLWLSGEGSWSGTIYAIGPGGQLDPKGRIGGTYEDPPWMTGPGTTTGRWRICP